MKLTRAPFVTTVVTVAWGVMACAKDDVVGDKGDGGGGISLGESPFVDAGAPDADKLATDGGFLGVDGSVMRADRFAITVDAFKPGACAGYGQDELPAVVQGPPVGSGRSSGGLDVVTLGIGGEIVVSFGANAIVDGPGPDFIVFENAFLVSGNESQIAADPGEVSVSEDGATWKVFPCTATVAPYGACAGWHPVYATPSNGISAFDVDHAGGDAFDLAEVGLARARFVRIVDKSTASCPVDKPPTNLGFDLDAVAIVHAASP